MKSFSALAMGVAAAIALAAAGAAHAAGTISGTWSLDRSTYGQHRIELRLSSDERGHESETTLHLDSMPSGPDFTVRRDAGTFHFTGTIAGDTGSGQFTFTPSTAFVNGLAARGVQTAGDYDVMAAADVDLTLPYIDSISAAGYRDIGFDHLLAFRALGVTPASIADLRAIFGQLSTEEIISTSALHITREYVDELRSMGIADITPQRAVTFKALHIDKAYLGELARMGYAHMDPQDIVSFKAMHIDAAYLEHLRAHGLKNLTPQQVIEMKATGL